jgi:CRISPR-associated protein Cmr3
MNAPKTTYRISAHDLLFFGTGRPFTMEDESWTEGIFPPYPATLYGFLRAIFFENNMEALAQANTENDPTQNLQVLDYHLELEKEGTYIPLYPLPHCFLKETEKLELSENVPMSNYPFSFILKRATTAQEGKPQQHPPLSYITKEQLNYFLNGASIATHTAWDTPVISLGTHLQSDHRIGIAKDTDTGITQDGKLYRINFTDTTFTHRDTLHKLHFNITITGLSLPKKHGRRLGGEGKIAFLEAITPSESTAVGQKEILEDEVLIFYAQTALITSSLTHLKEELNTHGCTLLCLANNSVKDIGGWDIQKRLPKPIKKAFPPGSLLFVKKSKDTPIHTHQILTLGEMTKEGFGKVITGIY